MCYLFSLICLFTSIISVGKGLAPVIFITFLISALIFGFFGMIFEVSNENSKNKWEAMVKTISRCTDMSPDQLKEFTEK